MITGALFLSIVPISIEMEIYALHGTPCKIWNYAYRVGLVIPVQQLSRIVAEPKKNNRARMTVGAHIGYLLTGGNDFFENI